MPKYQPRIAAPVKSPKPKYLIVCEGEKTEPQYFEKLRADFRLHSVLVIFSSGGWSSPPSLIDIADDKNNESVNKGEGYYEKIYIVFDHDRNNKKFIEGLKLCSEKKYVSIVSIPCFEIWLLLHFYDVEDINKIVKTSGKLNPCQILKTEEKRLVDSKKDNSRSYQNKNTEIAKERACELRHPDINQCDMEHLKEITTEPYTNVDHLVAAMQNLQTSQ